MNIAPASTLHSLLRPLVVGEALCIGSRMVKHLMWPGCDVVIPDNPSTPALPNIDPGMPITGILLSANRNNSTSTLSGLGLTIKINKVRLNSLVFSRGR